MEYAAGARLGRSNGHDLRLLFPGIACWSGLELDGADDLGVQ
jgi:hypothetical protein